MGDIREQLASHLYRSALDLDPMGAVALRIGHDDTLVWEVADEVLTVTVGEDDPLAFALTGTIGELADALEAADIEIRYANPDLQDRAAATLVSGSSGPEGRDQLLAFQSNLWALLDAYGVEVKAANLSLGEALKQLRLDTSEAEFLDVWGAFFAVPRLSDESDAAYRDRIVAEVLRPRSNGLAIEQTVLALTGKTVTLREPWKEIFTLGVSALSETDHLQDGSFFTWNVFQPIYHSQMTAADRDKIIEIIERNRPAGTVMVGAFAQPPKAVATYGFAPTGDSWVRYVYSSGLMHYQPGVMSSSLALSDYRAVEESEFVWTITGNVRVDISPDDALDLFVSNGWDEGRIWDDRPWNQPSVFSVVTQA